jgi:hypothetical protein
MEIKVIDSKKLHPKRLIISFDNISEIIQFLDLTGLNTAVAECVQKIMDNSFRSKDDEKLMRDMLGKIYIELEKVFKQ